MEKFDERGREIPDTTPMEVPANARKPESMQDMIARMVRAQVNSVAADNGFGSFEEEDDFHDPTEEVIDPMSGYYTTDAEMAPLDGSQESVEGAVDLTSDQDSGRGSPGDNSTDGLSVPHKGTFNEAEAPQE